MGKITIILLFVFGSCVLNSEFAMAAKKLRVPLKYKAIQKRQILKSPKKSQKVVRKVDSKPKLKTVLVPRESPVKHLKPVVRYQRRYPIPPRAPVVYAKPIKYIYNMDTRKVTGVTQYNRLLPSQVGIERTATSSDGMTTKLRRQPRAPSSVLSDSEVIQLK